MERDRYIRVPKDEKAMRDYDYGVQEIWQMEEIVLSEQQYQVLDDLGVFDKINQECDIVIDDYEEEVLSLEKIPAALSVISQLMEKNDFIELSKIKEIFELALKNKTVVGFDF